MADENPITARWNAAKDDLVEAARKADVDAGLLVKIAGFESGFNPHARPVAGPRHAELNTVTQFDGTKAMSSAYGYGQFLNGTWAQMVREHGSKYGVEGAADLTDKEANAAEIRNNTKVQAGLLAEFTKTNAETAAALGGSDEAANVYAMHNLGATDGARFLSAMATDPGARVDSVLSAKVINVNQSLYGDGSISLADAYKNMGDQMERYAPYAAEVAGYTLAPTSDPVRSATHGAPASGHSSHAALPAGGRTLREGMHGDDVRALQEHLRDLGFKDRDGRPLKADADFGPGTRAALETFQAQSHLSVDGVAGPVTLGRLGAQVSTRELKRESVTDKPESLLDDPSHPGNALYRQALEGMKKIDAAHGRTSDHVTSQVAGAIAAESHAQGLRRIDVVALSPDASRCWASQGQTNDPFKHLASVDMYQAVGTPLAKSTALWEQVSQQEVQAPPAVHTQIHEPGLPMSR